MEQKPPGLSMYRENGENLSRRKCAVWALTDQVSGYSVKSEPEHPHKIIQQIKHIIRTLEKGTHGSHPVMKAEALDSIKDLVFSKQTVILKLPTKQNGNNPALSNPE